MYFPLLFLVIRCTCFAFTPAAHFFVYSDYTHVLIGQFLVFILSTPFRTSFTLAVLPVHTSFTVVFPV